MQSERRQGHQDSYVKAIANSAKHNMKLDSAV